MVEDGELAVVKERKRRKVNCSQDDVLRMQQCLSLTRENLSLKKKKARTSSASFAAPG